jgi:hypothetical protein
MLSIPAILVMVFSMLIIVTIVLSVMPFSIR